MECAKVIVRERALPQASKTIPSVDVGGVAGGQKFVSHNVFFKFVTDDQGLYGSEDAALKAAGHELKGSRAFLLSGVRSLNTPLMALVDFHGCRIVACSLLPITGDTLRYGSADAGRTVLRAEDVVPLMDAAARAINLKTHMVGTTSRVPLAGPCDIEVHQGLDGRFYVLDTARVFPPGVPPRHVVAAAVPASTSMALCVFPPLPRDRARFETALHGAFASILHLEQEVMEEEAFKSGGEAPPRLPDVDVDGPSRLQLSWTLHPCGVGHLAVLNPALRTASGDVSPTQLYLRSNARASSMLGRPVRGPVVYLHVQKGQHLYCLLRPELVKRSRYPLVRGCAGSVAQWVWVGV